MNKKQKSSILLVSLASIAGAASLISGATYALFTSESKTNIAVTSGKVAVNATLSDLRLFSGKADSLVGDVSIDADNIIETTQDGKFTTGGTATLDDEKRNLTISNVVPGDKVTLKINVKNESNVNVKYRTIIKAVNNTGLFEGLTVKLANQEYHGNTLVSKYATLQKDSDDMVLDVEIGLPSDKKNEFQDKSTTISFTVEAIQGNAATSDAEDYEYLVYTPSDLTVFADLVNSGEFTYTDVLFQDDIDMKDAKYVSPVYNTNTVYKHDLNIIGGNHTISNFTPEHNVHGSGLLGGVFAGGNTVSVKDLNFDNVTITGDYNDSYICAGGVVVGSSDSGKVNISNVTVKNVNVSNVKYGGALIGYSSGTADIKDCTITTANVASYTAGGVLGQVGGNTTTIDNVKGSGISVDGAKREGGMVGAVSAGGTLKITNYDTTAYVASISGDALESHTNATVVGLKSTETYVNGTKITD